MQEVKAAAEKVDGADVIDEINDGFEKLLGGHIIGPLVSEYESQLKTLNREISTLKIALRTQADTQRELMTENGTLVKNLAVK